MSTSKSRVRSSKTTDDSKFSKAVYCLAPMHDNIVDAVLKIMDEDGPRPMRNMRPAQKLRNGAERFEIEHHGEYEARCQPSQNKVSRVNNHNMAYPKMYDELDKKRSLAKPTALSANRRQSAGYSVCRQSKNKPQKNTNRRRNRTKKYIKPQKGNPGISKPKQKIRQRNRSAANIRFSRIRTHKACQYSYQRKLVEKCVSTCNDYGSVQSMKTAGNIFDRQCEPNQDYQGTNKQKSLRVISMVSIKKEPKSDAGSHQETSLPSVTSYNSYLSMDHEPMVE